MSGVELDRGAHAGPQRRIVTVHLDGDTHGDALHHLDPVAGGVLGRDDGELRAGRLAEAFHRPVPLVVGVGIHVDRHRLAGPDVGEVGLLEVGFDPSARVRDQAHHRAAERGVADHLQTGLRGIAGNAGEGRADDGAFEIEGDPVDDRLRGEVPGVAVHRDVRVASELCPDLRHLLLGDPDPLPRHVEVVACGIELGAGDGVGRDQPGLPLELRVGERQVGPGERQLLLLLPVARLQAHDLAAHTGEPRLRFGQCDPIGPVVDAEQDVARGDPLVLAHGDLGDEAGDFRGDHHLVCLDVGVLRTDVPPARYIEIAANNRHDERAEEQQEAPQPAARRGRSGGGPAWPGVFPRGGVGGSLVRALRAARLLRRFLLHSK